MKTNLLVNPCYLFLLFGKPVNYKAKIIKGQVLWSIGQKPNIQDIISGNLLSLCSNQDRKYPMEGRKKLIYIDDEEYNLLLFKMSFKDKYEIFTSLSPIEGLDIIKREEIKVVITDYKMPGMNGLELINLVKNFQPDTICMLLSAYLENDIIADKQKVFKYIAKPYKQKELLQHIETAFSLNV